MAIFPEVVKRSSNVSYGPLDDYWYYPRSGPTTAGVDVSEYNALKYLTVFACISLIAGDVARLPLNLYKRRTDGGKDLIIDHPLYDLLHNAPNDEMTSFNWREASQGHLLLWGNHYSYIERDTTGNIKALWPLPDPGAVKVYRKNDVMIYEYKVDGQAVYRTKEQVFHIPGYGFNGIIGQSMIGLAREAIGIGLAAEQFQSKFYGEGTHPSIVVTLDPVFSGNLGENEVEYKKRLKDTISGLKNAHGIAVLPNGEKIDRLTMPLKDAQFLESRDYQKTEICGMYHVPPHKIAKHGQNSNYNNLEQENASYVDSCLVHWLTRWETQISLQLLKPEERKQGLFFEFLVAGLLRGDSQARAEYYNKIFQVGGISPNEIRSKENMNPDPDPNADKKYVMLNMVPLEDAGIDETPMVPSPDEGNTEEDERSYFKRIIQKNKEQKSIRMRDRLARAYAPLIRDAAQTVVNRESKAIKQKLTSRSKRSNDKELILKFLDEFYDKFPEYIRMKMGPILKSYLTAVGDESFREIGSENKDLDKEISDYIKSYVERHNKSSKNQMVALLEGEVEDLETRADEWHETRADKIATDEVVRAGSAAFAWVVFGAGLSLTWRIRGEDTCPYCRSLNGKKIRSDESFVNGGDEIDPKDGTGPMKFYGLKKHPPLHRGCDCYVST